MDIPHKFRRHNPAQDTRILILGTFHPDIENEADFFYGRSRNYLWDILPGCFGQPSLKGRPKPEKLAFMSTQKIDFADIISSLKNVPSDQAGNYDDIFIDKHIASTKDISGLIDSLKDLDSVYFTRKTFNGIPNIAEKISEIRNHCVNKCLRFCFLETPTYPYKGLQAKRDSWKATISDKTSCL